MTNHPNRSKKYRVHANACDFGIIEAASEQEARDRAAQEAGYQSEADMVERLEQPSEIVAEQVSS
jgi:hypothetical protein